MNLALAEKFSAAYNSELAFAIRNIIGEIWDLVECYVFCPECREKIRQSLEGLTNAPDELLN